jgi:hypothetical protein
LKEACPHENLLLDIGQTACEMKPLPLLTFQHRNRAAFVEGRAASRRTFRKDTPLPAQNQTQGMTIEKSTRSTVDTVTNLKFALLIKILNFADRTNFYLSFARTQTS